MFFAIKHAIISTRHDAGFDSWFELESPATPDRIHAACLYETIAPWIR